MTHPMVLLLAAVVGVGLAVYTYYNQQTPAMPSKSYAPYSPRSSYSRGSNSTDDDGHVDHQIRRRRKALIEEEKDECRICLEPLVQNVRVLECGHVYHRSCIGEWMQEQKQCPICRHKISM